MWRSQMTRRIPAYKPKPADVPTPTWPAAAAEAEAVEVAVEAEDILKRQRMKRKAVFLFHSYPPRGTKNPLKTGLSIQTDCPVFYPRTCGQVRKPVKSGFQYLHIYVAADDESFDFYH